VNIPVQGGAGGPLDYAPSWARRAGTTGASIVSPLQELQDLSRQIVTSVRDDRDPGTPLGLPSSRNGLASLNPLSSRDIAPKRSALSQRQAFFSRDSFAAQDSLLARDASRLRPTLLPEPPLARAKSSIFAATARLRVVVLVAGGALGFLWLTAVPLRETPRPAFQDVPAERVPDPSATVEQAAGVAMYQNFLKWRQLQGK
jgi:hypothetical protein